MDDKEFETSEQEAEISETAETEEEKLTLAERIKISILDWAETIVSAIVIVALIFTFLARIITVEGGSMKPTYHQGDRVLVNAFSKDYKQGDVVIIVNALRDPIIKRVIATEGQTVNFDEELREVVVDGEPLYGVEFGIDNGITFLPESPSVLHFPQTVPENCVFVLGDNRGNSTDSRFMDVGMIDTRNILGKVFFNLYPFSNIGFTE